MTNQYKNRIIFPSIYLRHIYIYRLLSSTDSLTQRTLANCSSDPLSIQNRNFGQTGSVCSPSDYWVDIFISLEFTLMYE